jgi:hypothetical protein
VAEGGGLAYASSLAKATTTMTIHATQLVIATIRPTW